MNINKKIDYNNKVHKIKRTIKKHMNINEYLMVCKLDYNHMNEKNQKMHDNIEKSINAFDFDDLFKFEITNNYTNVNFEKNQLFKNIKKNLLDDFLSIKTVFVSSVEDNFSFYVGTGTFDESWISFFIEFNEYDIDELIEGNLDFKINEVVHNWPLDEYHE